MGSSASKSKQVATVAAAAAAAAVEAASSSGASSVARTLGASSSGAGGAPLAAPLAAASSSIFASSNMKQQERNVLKQGAHKMEDFMDAGILNEMKAWPAVRSSVDEAALKLRTSNETMATMVRFREEARLQDRFGQQPKRVAGKLTEEQLMSIFVRARENKAWSADGEAEVAREFSLSAESVRGMLATALAPKLVSKGASAKLNDKIVAV